MRLTVRAGLRQLRRSVRSLPGNLRAPALAAGAWASVLLVLAPGTGSSPACNSP